MFLVRLQPFTDIGGYFFPTGLTADPVPAVWENLEIADAKLIAVCLRIALAQLIRNNLIFFAADEQ